MVARRQSELEERFKPTQWCIGSEQFRQEMLKHIEQQRGRWHYGPELAEAAHAKAERIIQQTLCAESISEERLAKLRKGHAFKVRLAAKLRAETTVTLKWIAERLNMGTRGHLAHLLFTNKGNQTTCDPSNQMPLGL
jgi:hypothetical protein